MERVRGRIAGRLTCPVYVGPSKGELSIANHPVLLQQKMMSVLRTIDSGAMQLEPDQQVDGHWVTVPDVYTRRRVELLVELTADFLSVSHKMATAETVSVYLISGDVVQKAHADVTATD